MDASLGMQGAIIARLKSDATVMGLISGIYDWVPESQDPEGIFPFVTTDSASFTRWRVLGADGEQGTITLSIWSEYRGFKEALEIKDAIQAAIEGSPLSVDGLNVVRCEYDSHHTMRDPDGRTRHVPVIFRAQVQYS